MLRFWGNLGYLKGPRAECHLLEPHAQTSLWRSDIPPRSMRTITSRAAFAFQGGWDPRYYVYLWQPLRGDCSFPDECIRVESCMRVYCVHTPYVSPGLLQRLRAQGCWIGPGTGPGCMHECICIQWALFSGFL